MNITYDSFFKLPIMVNGCRSIISDDGKHIFSTEALKNASSNIFGSHKVSRFSIIADFEMYNNVHNIKTKRTDFNKEEVLISKMRMQSNKQINYAIVDYDFNVNSVLYITKNSDRVLINDRKSHKVDNIKYPLNINDFKDLVFDSRYFKISYMANNLKGEFGKINRLLVDSDSKFYFHIDPDTLFLYNSFIFFYLLMDDRSNINEENLTDLYKKVLKQALNNILYDEDTNDSYIKHIESIGSRILNMLEPLKARWKDNKDVSFVDDFYFYMDTFYKFVLFDIILKEGESSSISPDLMHSYLHTVKVKLSGIYGNCEASSYLNKKDLPFKERKTYKLERMYIDLNGIYKKKYKNPKSAIDYIEQREITKKSSSDTLTIISGLEFIDELFKDFIFDVIDENLISFKNDIPITFDRMEKAIRESKAILIFDEFIKTNKFICDFEKSLVDIGVEVDLTFLMIKSHIELKYTGSENCIKNWVFIKNSELGIPSDITSLVFDDYLNKLFIKWVSGKSLIKPSYVMDFFTNVISFLYTSVIDLVEHEKLINIFRESFKRIVAIDIDLTISEMFLSNNVIDCLESGKYPTIQNIKFSRLSLECVKKLKINESILSYDDMNNHSNFFYNMLEISTHSDSDFKIDIDFYYGLLNTEIFKKTNERNKFSNVFSNSSLVSLSNLDNSKNKLTKKLSNAVSNMFLSYDYVIFDYFNYINLNKDSFIIKDGLLHNYLYADNEKYTNSFYIASMLIMYDYLIIANYESIVNITPKDMDYIVYFKEELLKYLNNSNINIIDFIDFNLIFSKYFNDSISKTEESVGVNRPKEINEIYKLDSIKSSFRVRPVKLKSVFELNKNSMFLDKNIYKRLIRESSCKGISDRVTLDVGFSSSGVYPSLIDKLNLLKKFTMSNKLDEVSSDKYYDFLIKSSKIVLDNNNLSTLSLEYNNLKSDLGFSFDNKGEDYSILNVNTKSINYSSPISWYTLSGESRSETGLIALIGSKMFENHILIPIEISKKSFLGDYKDFHYYYMTFSYNVDDVGKISSYNLYFDNINESINNLLGREFNKKVEKLIVNLIDKINAVLK